jgi:hypothetical protein
VRNAARVSSRKAEAEASGRGDAAWPAEGVPRTSGSKRTAPARTSSASGPNVVVAERRPDFTMASTVSAVGTNPGEAGIPTSKNIPVPLASGGREVFVARFAPATGVAAVAEAAAATN